MKLLQKSKSGLLKLTSHVIIICMLLTIVGASATAAKASEVTSTLSRPNDPVILKGADIPQFIGISPDELVAFSFIDGSWVQIPVQVDEMKVANYALEIYNGAANSFLTSAYSSYSNLVYADPSTFTGADPSIYIDSDDEIVFMATDAGGLYNDSGLPTGVDANIGHRIQIVDPLDISKVGYVYLFKSTGGLDPAAGKDYVTYDFRLLEGDGTYKANYRLVNSTNPEDSTITTENYEYHFSDRWLDDGIKIKVDEATGVDILDRNRVATFPTGTYRTENTFCGYSSDESEGAFVCNIDGPVRAIRSFLGANSGPLTQRTYYFYANRVDMVTDVRVHPMPVLSSFFNFSSEAVGMMYYNDKNTCGVRIDGILDLTCDGKFSTELVAGPQGGMVISSRIETDIPGGSLDYNGYFRDSFLDRQATSGNPTIGATGIYFYKDHAIALMDASAILLALLLGWDVNEIFIPNTDPVSSSTYYNLRLVKNIVFRGPSATFPQALEDTQKAHNPLTVAVSDIN